MGIDDKYFKEKVKNISFVQLKDQRDITINNYTIDSSLPLPVITDNLLSDLSRINAKQEITIERIIEGILYLLGGDREFVHKEDYLNILKAYSKDIDKVIFSRAIKEFENNDLNKSGLYLRTYNSLFSSAYGLFYYGMILEALSKEEFLKENLEIANKFLEESTKILEELLIENPNFYPSYYKLGYHYKFYEQFVKAKLTWEKALNLDPDLSRKDEIRVELENIDYEYRMELTDNYILNLNYSKAIETLAPLTAKYKSDWKLYYLLGMSYRGLGYSDSSKEYFNLSLEFNHKNPDTYNELGIVYFNDGDLLEAVDVFSKGIDNSHEDYRLYFNRGLGYLNLGMIDKGYEDIKLAYKLNPNDDNIAKQLKALESYYKNLEN